MAIFIIENIIVKDEKITTINIVEIYNSVSVGDVFQTFDTHHPINWEIINRSGLKKIQLTCSTKYQSKIYVEMFDGAIIDTENNNQKFYEYDVQEKFKKYWLEICSC